MLAKRWADLSSSTINKEGIKAKTENICVGKKHKKAQPMSKYIKGANITETNRFERGEITDIPPNISTMGTAAKQVA